MVSISSSNLDGESPILSRPAIADWCNGSTLDSESRDFGPTPRSADIMYRCLWETTGLQPLLGVFDSHTVLYTWYIAILNIFTNHLDFGSKFLYNVF